MAVDGQPIATIIITTRNRRDELRRALSSCMRQTGAPEIIVIDDGSDDGTDEMVRVAFPSIRLVRSETSLGLIVQRNRGARLAHGPIIVSIDDDAEFSDQETVARTLAEFDDPRVGAIAIPFINVLADRAIRQRSPEEGRRYVAASYIGTAHAVRRDVFLRLGGYREQLFHQGEEGDFCVRMLAAGFLVRLGSADPIRHYESPRRDMRRMDLYGGRNQVLFAWHNVPGPYVPLDWCRVVLSRLRWGMRTRRLLRGIQSAWFGFSSVRGEWGQRKAVGLTAYRVYRHLERRGAMPMEQACKLLQLRGPTVNR
jgi:glycosyltransferase involved in cell wall biosynthesis